jgi:hypothetical protein
VLPFPKQLKYTWDPPEYQFAAQFVGMFLLPLSIHCQIWINRERERERERVLSLVTLKDANKAKRDFLKIHIDIDIKCS